MWLPGCAAPTSISLVWDDGAGSTRPCRQRVFVANMHEGLVAQSSCRLQIAAGYAGFLSGATGGPPCAAAQLDVDRVFAALDGVSHAETALSTR